LRTLTARLPASPPPAAPSPALRSVSSVGALRNRGSPGVQAMSGAGADGGRGIRPIPAAAAVEMVALRRTTSLGPRQHGSGGADHAAPRGAVDDNDDTRPAEAASSALAAVAAALRSEGVGGGAAGPAVARLRSHYIPGIPSLRATSGRIDAISGGGGGGGGGRR
jgi:hypothetical protein